jgi:hypothetical protein
MFESKKILIEKHLKKQKRTSKASKSMLAVYLSSVLEEKI